MTQPRATDLSLHDAECATLARPIGSGFRYACLPLTSTRLGAVTAWRALDLTLRQITEQIAEPQVARSKLDWWRGALDEALNRQHASHPILHALRAHSRPEQLTALIEPIEARLGAAWLALDYQGFATAADRNAYLAADGGALWQGFAILLDAPAEQHSAFRALGAASQRLDQLQYLGRALARGVFVLPASALAARGLADTDWLRPGDQPALDAVLTAEWDELLAQYRHAHAALAQHTRRPAGFFRALLAQDRARLRLLAPRILRLRAERPELSPFTLLTTAWWANKRPLPREIRL
ncbi:squalene/phytoene synthase family protein [Halothiobacillus sp. DCM-1]|uniref:squalene/phytoene synthase family protein n=1 Tax=Halothiobacillus sp. DCM-1 TaxID=3112558 RepID=UPI00324A3313